MPNAQAVSRTEFDNLYKQLNGNGTPGIRQKVDEIHEFVIRQKTIEEDRARRSKQRRWLSGIAVALLATPATWFGGRSVQFFHDLYQITQEWHEVHKSELKQKSFFSTPESVYADTQQPSQSSGLPNMR